MSTFWTHCLERFAQELSPQQMAMWLRPLQSHEAAHGVELLAPNLFVAKWVRERFLPRIRLEAREYFGTETPISITVAENSPRRGSLSNGCEPGRDRSEEEARRSEHAARSGAASGRRLSDKFNDSALRGPEHARPDSALNPQFRFETFVTGKANQLAQAAAAQVASNPGSAYNPLFIYGGVGLGKTHLLQAIGNAVADEHPGTRIRYLHAERYVSDVVRAYQNKQWDNFKAQYLALDLLLIDDIQFFNGKSSTQEQFFYLFNGLIESGKQIVITCDTYPKEIEGIEARLKSRFSWGLTVQIEPPETEMRVAILLAKARALGIELDEHVAFFIAKHINSNVRELEGGLKRVIAYASFHGVEITPTVAKEALRDLLAVQSRQVSIDNIQRTVAEYYKIKVSDMHSKNRQRVLARPRQMAMALAKELTSLSLPEIGQNFGGRDHTTVLHACRQIARLRERSPQIQHDYAFLLQTLRG
ncbi:MAG: chromosomal replication initiator protein DnaA [Casimicrobiaceae bacterium]|nr:chromosomal replication initiator protein DnaA [Casimicrobiaceae bacterium]MDW8311461.1 chromosomal replication initiator protein DnaA [Burkholderiales bacterium]